MSSEEAVYPPRRETSLTIREQSEDLSTPYSESFREQALNVQFSTVPNSTFDVAPSVFGVWFRIVGPGELHCERLADWLNSAFNSIALCLVV